MSDILNVGCGAAVDPTEGVINLDMHPYPGVQVVHNLDVTPWPFEDESFDGFWAAQVFEHVENPVGFMTEAWRVLRPGGTAFITVPHYKSDNAFTDPTHRRFCTERTWDYWIAGRPLHQQFGPAYGGVAFSTGHIARWNDDIQATLVK